MTQPPNTPSPNAKTPRLGVRLLPAVVRRSFSREFIPSVLEEVGWSMTPWENLDVKTLQICMNDVYPELEYVVEKGDAIDLSVSSASPQSMYPHLAIP